MNRRPMCCECLGKQQSGKLIPYAKRGNRLVFVCHVCYMGLHYFEYFFENLLARA